jgi:hypothetical protein
MHFPGSQLLRSAYSNHFQEDQFKVKKTKFLLDVRDYSLLVQSNLYLPVLLPK